MNKPLALDLFCGAGGATRGLQMAGFEVVGIDIKKQPRYCGEWFIQADALNPPVQLNDFDLIWASPPCQRFSRGTGNYPSANNGQYPDLIAPVRELLSSYLYVIENVPGATLRPNFILDGWQFLDLKVIRCRHFEASWNPLSLTIQRPRGLLHQGYLSIAGTGIQKWCKDKGYRFSTKDARNAMGINWMTRAELSQAVPPAYANFIGHAALQYLQEKRAA